MNRAPLMMWSALLWMTVTVAVSAAPDSTDSQQPASELKQSARRILAEPEFRHFEHFADDAFRKGEPPAPAEDGTNNATPSSDGTKDGSGTESSNTGNDSSSNEPWWKRALNRSQPSQPGGNSGSSRKQRLSPNGSSPSGDGQSAKTGEGNGGSGSPTTPDSSAKNGSSNTGEIDGANGRSTNYDGASRTENTTRQTDTKASPTTERPPRAPTERPARTGKPSQRGSDGVERPVRQASRVPNTPKPEAPTSSPTWNGPSLGIGNLLGGVFHGLAYLILAVVVVAIVMLIGQALLQAWNDRPRNIPGMTNAIVGPLTHDRSPGETESDVFVQEALALARQGEFRAAIGRLVLGGMSFIERQQWIRYRRGLTVHDYLRVLRSHPEQFAGFRQVVHVFEPVEYGRRLATESLFDAALQGYRRGFQTGTSIPGEAT